MADTHLSEYTVWRITSVNCASCELEEPINNLESSPEVCSNCKRRALRVIKDVLVAPKPEMRELLALYLQKKYPTYADYAKEENILKFIEENNLDSRDAAVIRDSFINFFKHLGAQTSNIPLVLIDFFKPYEIVWLAKQFSIIGKTKEKNDLRVRANILNEWLQGKAELHHTLNEDVAIIYNPATGLHERGAEALLNVLLSTTAQACSAGDREEIIKTIKAQNAVSSLDELKKAPPFFIACKNGVLDLRTLKLLPFSSEYGFTEKLAVSYNSDARAVKINLFINEVCSEAKDALPDLKMVRALKQLVAYCLWKGYPIQKLFFLIGAGANGKGIFCAVLQALLGAENVSNTTISKLCYDRFASADLEGKFANIANEMTVSEVKNFDAIKSMTSGTDRIRIERKGVQGYTIAPHAKVITASNKPPKSPDASDGFFRRLILFFFQRQFYGQDAKLGLEQELITELELSGLLNEAVVELRLWLDVEGNFLPSASFVNDLPVDEIREIYERASDTVAAFEYECCDFTDEPSDEISKDALYSAYRKFCKKSKLPPLGSLQFKKEFKERNGSKLQEAHSRKGKEREHVYIGLKMVQEEQDKTISNLDNDNILSLTRVNKIIPVPPVPKDSIPPLSSYSSKETPVPPVPNETLTILYEIPAWKIPDGNIYGPYSPGQIVQLPAREADFLLKVGKAQPAKENTPEGQIPSPHANLPGDRP